MKTINPMSQHDWEIIEILSNEKTSFSEKINICLKKRETEFGVSRSKLYEKLGKDAESYRSRSYLFKKDGKYSITDVNAAAKIIANDNTLIEEMILSLNELSGKQHNDDYFHAKFYELLKSSTKELFDIEGYFKIIRKIDSLRFQEKNRDCFELACYCCRYAIERAEKLTKNNSRYWWAAAHHASHIAIRGARTPKEYYTCLLHDKRIADN